MAIFSSGGKLLTAGAGKLASSSACCCPPRQCACDRWIVTIDWDGITFGYNGITETHFSSVGGGPASFLTCDLTFFSNSELVPGLGIRPVETACFPGFGAPGSTTKWGDSRRSIGWAAERPARPDPAFPGGIRPATFGYVSGKVKFSVSVFHESIIRHSTNANPPFVTYSNAQAGSCRASRDYNFVADCDENGCPGPLTVSQAPCLTGFGRRTSPSGTCLQFSGTANPDDRFYNNEEGLCCDECDTIDALGIPVATLSHPCCDGNPLP